MKKKYDIVKMNDIYIHISDIKKKAKLLLVVVLSTKKFYKYKSYILK